MASTQKSDLHIITTRVPQSSYRKLLKMRDRRVREAEQVGYISVSKMLDLLIQEAWAREKAGTR